MVHLLVVVVFQNVITQGGDGNMKEVYEIRFKYQETGHYKRLNAYNDIKYALEMVRKLNAQYGEEEPFYMKTIRIED